MVALRSLRTVGPRRFLFRERVTGLRMVRTAGGPRWPRPAARSGASDRPGEADRETARAADLAGRAGVEVEAGAAGDPERLPVHGSLPGGDPAVVHEVDPELDRTPGQYAKLPRQPR